LGVERQGPGCPEFFGIAEVDGFRTGDSHEPGARFGSNLCFAPSAGTVFQRSQGTHFKRPVEDPLDLRAIGLEGFG